MPEAGGWPGMFVVDSCEVADIVGECDGGTKFCRSTYIRDVALASLADISCITLAHAKLHLTPFARHIYINPTTYVVLPSLCSLATSVVSPTLCHLFNLACKVLYPLPDVPFY